MRMTQSSQARAARELAGWNASLEAGAGSSTWARQVAARKSQMRSQASSPAETSSLLAISPATPVTARSWALLGPSCVWGGGLPSAGVAGLRGCFCSARGVVWGLSLTWGAGLRGCFCSAWRVQGVVWGAGCGSGAGVEDCRHAWVAGIVWFLHIAREAGVAAA